MVFSSLTFLFFFLPLALFLYYIGPKKFRNSVLLILSILFYAWGEPVYVLLILFSTIMDYFFGRAIAHYLNKNELVARLFLSTSIVMSIGILSFFKYADFLVHNINAIMQTEISPLELPLPIGISFYTFQSLSYIIDVYRGRVAVQKNPVRLMMYIALFPQLIAGPIVRYKLIEHQLANRKWDTKQFSEGVQIFTIGLAKKVLLANNIGMLWATISAETGELALFTAWLGISAFALQIYFDFSGYSNMAIGLGKMFGFDFPENFRYPYIATSVTEFWRRWHITLGQWFRDYIYIPLGGSRVRPVKIYRNLFIVWTLTGLWHGASWNYVLWGIYFGILIALEKAFLQKFLEKLPIVFRHLYLIFIVLVGWVFFVFEDTQQILIYLKAMFFPANNLLYDAFFFYQLTSYAAVLIVCIIASTSLFRSIWAKIPPAIQPIFATAGMLAMLVLSTAYLVDESFNPFIYFRF